MNEVISGEVSGEVAIETEYDIVTARKAVRQAAVDFGFGTLAEHLPVREDRNRLVECATRRPGRS